MTHTTNDDAVSDQVATIRVNLPNWVIATSQLVEHAQNAERAAVQISPDVADRSRKLIVEIAEWQQRLGQWQSQPVTPRLGTELRILKATLDAAMDEANSAARVLHLFE